MAGKIFFFNNIDFFIRKTLKKFKFIFLKSSEPSSSSFQKTAKGRKPMLTAGTPLIQKIELSTNFLFLKKFDRQNPFNVVNIKNFIFFRL